MTADIPGRRLSPLVAHVRGVLSGRDLPIERRHILIVCACLLAAAATAAAIQFSQAQGIVLPNGGALGGDYIAFHAAAGAARDGAGATVYDPATFEAMLRTIGPDRERYGLTWQYPPTYFFLLLPLAFLPYAVGYALWTMGTAAALFASLRAVGLNALVLFVVLASPAAFQSAITGQNGFLTAGLLALAAFFPDKRPILAGVAAALLTTKPHLGVLIPIAYLAAGCWRAFAVAALAAVGLAAASVFAFGIEAWTGFVGGATGAAGAVATGLMPLYKMTTPFAAFRLAGIPTEIAAALHGALAIAATIGVALIWRRVRDAGLRAAALVAGVFIVAPYGYYYELVILALPVALVARRALERGWLPYEQLMVALICAAPLMLPGDAKRIGLAWGFFVVLGVAALVLRRIARDAPAPFCPAPALSPPAERSAGDRIDEAAGFGAQRPGAL